MPTVTYTENRAKKWPHIAQLKSTSGIIIVAPQIFFLTHNLFTQYNFTIKFCPNATAWLSYLETLTETLTAHDKSATHNLWIGNNVYPTACGQNQTLVTKNTSQILELPKLADQQFSWEKNWNASSSEKSVWKDILWVCILWKTNVCCTANIL